MRHRVAGFKLGRDTNERKALLNNLAADIIKNRKITTTLSKAKFAKPYIEKLITASKLNKLAVRRKLAASLPNSAFKRLIFEIGPGFKNRPGGYTRIIRLASRRGDNAPLAKLELLPYEPPPKSESNAKAKTQTKKKAPRFEKTKSNEKRKKL